MDRLTLRALAHLNYLLAAICLLAGVTDIWAAFRHNMWGYIIEGILLLAAGALLFYNGLRMGGEDGK